MQHHHSLKTLTTILRTGWPFIAVVILVLGFSLLSMSILSAARAYVGGEGLWSKAQKEAVWHLIRYAETRDQAEFKQYQNAIEVPLSDRRVRLELDKRSPDYEHTRDNFVRGGNHADDHNSVAMLYRYFGKTSLMRDSVQAWIEGDTLIDALRTAAESLRTAIDGDADTATIARHVADIRRINDELIPLENRFSEALGEASRTVTKVLGMTMAILTSILLLAGLWLSGRIVRRANQAEAEVEAQRERAGITLRSISDAVITTDNSGRIEFMNPAAERLTGWQFADARGLSLPRVFRALDEVTREYLPNPVEMSLRERRAVPPTARTMLRRRDGTEISIDEQTAPLHDPDGNVTGAVLVFQDVSAERRFTAELSYQAKHDALTDLPNRREFEHRVTAALASASPQDPIALIYLDVDQFKVVNDTSGHAAGDELLRAVGMALKRILRRTDVLARLGGDEFGLLVTHCPPDRAAQIAEAMRDAIYRLGFSWEGRAYRVTGSVGLVSIAESGRSLVDALSAADRACYLAKDKGRNRVQIHNPADAETQRRHGEMGWVTEIHHAIAENRFRLYAQKIQRLRDSSGRADHCEMLIRLINPQGEMVPPMAFLPAAERFGLMPDIDRWVIDQCFSQLAQRQLFGDTPGLCAINLSGASLNDERMLDHIRGQFERHAISAASICFEITETVAISALGGVGNFMRELHALGCRFSLDDFGSGMSSFGYLRELPVDFIKIDGRFVKNMATDHIDRAIVQSIQQIGEVMGIATIAEWVEDPATISLLRDMGVNYAQGYAVGRPAPFEKMHFMIDKPEPVASTEPMIVPLPRTKHRGE